MNVKALASDVKELLDEMDRYDLCVKKGYPLSIRRSVAEKVLLLRKELRQVCSELLSPPANNQSKLL